MAPPLCRLRYFVMSPSLFRYGAFVISLWRDEKTLNSGLQGANLCLHVFVLSSSLFRYVPSFFRYGDFVISFFRFSAFVMSPRNNEKTKWHKSATIECLYRCTIQMSDSNAR